MTTQSAPARPCSACAEVAGDLVAPGGVILDDGFWYISHHTGPYTDPGELIVKTRRHCESLAELTLEEARALGPLLRSAVGALERTVVAELARNPDAASRAAVAGRVRQELEPI